MRNAILVMSALLAAPLYAAVPQTLILDIQNMHCPLCPITVKAALEKVPGVAEAKIDFYHKTALVRFDPEKANPARLTKATAEAGFPATLRK